MKTIGINASNLNTVQVSGLHMHVETVLDSIDTRANSFKIFTSNRRFIDVYGSLVVETPEALGLPGTKANLKRLLWYQKSLPAKIKKEKVDLFYSPLSEGMLRPKVPQVITIHDLLPLHFPEQYPRIQWFYRVLMPMLIRHSKAILVDSQSTRSDLYRFYGEISTPVHVTYVGYRRDIFKQPAPNAISEVKQKYGLGNYLLNVSEMRKYKNIRSLIKGFAQVQRPDLQLVIVGKVHHLDPDIQSFPASLGEEVARRVLFLGFAPLTDLPALYAGAEMLVFPSLVEGFGIPMVEAMACGCPVAASNTSSMPEISGDAAIYFDPLDITSIRQAIELILGNPDLQSRMRIEGVKRAALYNNKEITKRIVEVCNQSLQTA